MLRSTTLSTASCRVALFDAPTAATVPSSARMIPANPAFSERSRARCTRGSVPDTRQSRTIDAPTTAHHVSSSSTSTSSGTPVGLVAGLLRLTAMAAPVTSATTTADDRSAHARMGMRLFRKSTNPNADAMSRKMLTAASTIAAVPENCVTLPRIARRPRRPTATAR